MNSYVIATVKGWNITNYHDFTPYFPGDWHLISQPNDLSLAKLREISPRYIFFPHWSWLVPSEILNEFECVCFHMTDVPYGRGGSPLQNLIVRGHQETKLTALKMTSELDAGPVYFKEPLKLNGTAQEIFLRSSTLTFQMIKYIVENEPEPYQQTGETVIFNRRTQAQSELPETLELEKVYDLIRMLDAETYPKAFIQYGNYKIEFSDANLIDSDCLTAKITLTQREETEVKSDNGN